MTLKNISSLYRSPYFAVFVDLQELAKKHKKKVLIFLAFEFWVHSLVWQHLSELKSILELLPFN